MPKMGDDHKVIRGMRDTIRHSYAGPVLPRANPRDCGTCARLMEGVREAWKAGEASDQDHCQILLDEHLQDRPHG